MPRHKFMVDLLRPEMTVESLTELIQNKRELTQDDLSEILEGIAKVLEAVTNCMED